MASGRMEFHAQSIMQHANFAYALPYDTEMEEVRDPSNYDRETKSLILLHGLTGTDTDWLYGGIETGTGQKSKSFTYGNEYLAEIPEGKYYTTIIHFADGTTVMTGVNKK